MGRLRDRLKSALCDLAQAILPMAEVGGNFVCRWSAVKYRGRWDGNPGAGDEMEIVIPKGMRAASYVKSEETLLLTSPTAGAPLTLRSRCPATGTKVTLFRSHGNGPSWPRYYPIGPNM